MWLPLQPQSRRSRSGSSSPGRTLYLPCYVRPSGCSARSRSLFRHWRWRSACSSVQYFRRAVLSQPVSCQYRGAQVRLGRRPRRRGSGSTSGAIRGYGRCLHYVALSLNVRACRGYCAPRDNVPPVPAPTRSGRDLSRSWRLWRTLSPLSLGREPSPRLASRSGSRQAPPRCRTCRTGLRSCIAASQARATWARRVRSTSICGAPPFRLEVSAAWMVRLASDGSWRVRLPDPEERADASPQTRPTTAPPGVAVQRRITPVTVLLAVQE